MGIYSEINEFNNGETTTGRILQNGIVFIPPRLPNDDQDRDIERFKRKRKSNETTIYFQH